MPQDDSITMPPAIKLLLEIAALSLRLKAQEREIAELRDRLARLEAERAK
jgi:hypothetical protein